VHLTFAALFCCLELSSCSELLVFYAVGEKSLDFAHLPSGNHFSCGSNSVIACSRQ
jgi:hypothetical protein